MIDHLDTLERGRRGISDRAWSDAFVLLSKADAVSPLGADDLEHLATAAYMVGRDDDMVTGLERAHQLHLDSGDVLRAVRAAFWVGINLALRGEMGPASGWFGRAHRLVEGYDDDCAEAGYLLLPAVIQQAHMGDHAGAYATAAEAIDIGQRFNEHDLVALAVHEQGRSLVRQGRVEEGLQLLDEAMVAVTADDLSPIVTGLIYCSVIEGCYEVHELRRAHEWTSALSEWCGEQPDMVAFTGQCLVHRAEIMQLCGDWSDALAEARRASRRFLEGINRMPAAQAYYRQGELYRLRGEFPEAEQAYRDASRWGWSPQPGLALLRLAQGTVEPAAAALTRMLGETSEGVERARLLPALVEILLAAGDTVAARDACNELVEISSIHGTDLLGATAGYVRGAVDLAEGQPQDALAALRRAERGWLEVDAPYETARVRALVGLACRELGDEDAATLELDAARAVFARLGATPDVARVESLIGRHPPQDTRGLTARELEVLRLVAAGGTNKAIAAELVVSGRTVDRHVSNIFAKLGVTSRAAATAYAYQHRLV